MVMWHSRFANQGAGGGRRNGRNLRHIDPILTLAAIFAAPHGGRIGISA